MKHINRIKLSNKPAATLIGTALFLFALISLLYILLPHRQTNRYIAEIYQDGELLTGIPLSDVKDIYTFTVTSPSGCQNRVEVRPGSIGIISAACPDKLCVHQGFISDSRIPITCLPNRLVILLRPAEQPGTDSSDADMITY